jgi:GNAT superfamily N-acetyltransferase
MTLAAFRGAMFAELGGSPAAGFERHAAAFVAGFERKGYLLNVYTEPRWRGHGVAGALVAAAARGRELGMARLRLHTTAQGRPVYAAAGFIPRQDEMELVLTDRSGASDPETVHPG